MVNIQSTQLDALYSALGDSTRRAILEQLRHGPTKVSYLAQPQAMSLPGVMKHIGVLERAGLVTKMKKGRSVHCQLDATALKQAADWISRYEAFWEQKLDSLAVYLEELDEKGE
jgi:DNA-binding transcriptional ArsR family regulator